MEMIIKRVGDKMIAVGKVVGGRLYPLDAEVPKVDLRKEAAELDKAVYEEWGEPLGKIAGLDRSEVASRLEKAACAGKIDSRVLSLFDAHPLVALADIPEDVAEEFAIPVVDEDWAKSHRPSTLPWWLQLRKPALEEAMQKSARELGPGGLTKAQLEQAGDRLEAAAVNGDLDPTLLSVFDVDPIGALRSVPADVASKYELSDFAESDAPGRRDLRKAHEPTHVVPYGQYEATLQNKKQERESLTKSELIEAERNLQRAVVDGFAGSALLGSFPIRPLWVLGEIDPEIARLYSLPRVTAAAAASQAPRPH